jgi:hypothetical protein
MPAMPFASTTNVKIEVYSGAQSPEQLIAEKIFFPQYQGYNTSGNFGFENISTHQYPTEHFVAFDNPVKVDKKFFIAYKINYSTVNKFVIYNIKLGAGEASTAWIKNEQGTWVRANAYTTQPIATSLAIQPLLRYGDDVSIPAMEPEKGNQLRYLREENRLILSGESLEAGQVLVYSGSGQIIQKIVFGKGQNSVVLKPQNKGTIGIVRVLQGNETYSGKIIY